MRNNVIDSNRLDVDQWVEVRNPLVSPNRTPPQTVPPVQVPSSIVVFSLDGYRYGLALDATERVVPAVEVRPLLKAPAIVMGVFNLHGRVVPVMNLRRRFGLPERLVGTADQFIVARAAGRSVALAVDGTEGVVETSPQRIIPSESILPELPYVKGILRMSEGLVFIHDLASFLALDEAAALDAALRA